MSEKPQAKDQYGPPLGSMGSRMLPASLVQNVPRSTMIRPTGSRPTTAQIVQAPVKINTPRPRGSSPNPLVPCSNRYTILQYHNTIGSSSSSSPSSDYLEKPEPLPIFPVEPSWINTQPREIASKLFPLAFQYLPSHILKTRTYYEFILIDTESVEITHTKDHLDQLKFSKFKILKVISIEEWGQPLFQAKTFSRAYNPQMYNYYDYIDAWYNTLFYLPFKHSWFFWFKKNISLKFPSWFVKWFYDFGPLPTIFSPEVQNALQYFKDHTNFPQGYRLMTFTASQAITWIMTWDYSIAQLYDNSEVCSLVRSIRIKWWSKFNHSLVEKPKLDEWIKINVKMTSSPKALPSSSSQSSNESLFLQEKSRIMAELAAVTSHEEFSSQIKRLNTLASSSTNSEVKEEDALSLSPTDINLLQDNEDDCYGFPF